MMRHLEGFLSNTSSKKTLLAKKKGKLSNWFKAGIRSGLNFSHQNSMSDSSSLPFSEIVLVKNLSEFPDEAWNTQLLVRWGILNWKSIFSVFYKFTPFRSAPIIKIRYGHNNRMNYYYYCCYFTIVKLTNTSHLNRIIRYAHDVCISRQKFGVHETMSLITKSTRHRRDAANNRTRLEETKNTPTVFNRVFYPNMLRCSCMLRAHETRSRCYW